MKKYYDILGLECDSTEEKIKSVYRKLTKIYHPDMPDTGNEKMFKKINEAFNEIKNNNFECGKHSDEDNYQEKKENNNQYNNSNHDKNYYRNATARVITGVFDGLVDIFLSIFKINFFSKILNFIKFNFVIIFNIVLFIYYTIIRFFLRYGWVSILFIMIWPVGLIVLFWELFRSNESIEKAEDLQEKKRNWIFEILVVISIVWILAGTLFVAINPRRPIENNKNTYNDNFFKIRNMNDFEKEREKFLLADSLRQIGLSDNEINNQVADWENEINPPIVEEQDEEGFFDRQARRIREGKEQGGVEGYLRSLEAVTSEPLKKGAEIVGDAFMSVLGTTDDILLNGMGGDILTPAMENVADWNISKGIGKAYNFTQEYTDKQ